MSHSSFDGARGECWCILPGLSLGRLQLPWAFARLRRSTAVQPEGTNCACGCLRKECSRRYQPRPRCWNQRYCGDPECLRQVRRWQAARRQPIYRLAAHVKARHARAERARRQRVNAVSQTIASPEIHRGVVTRRELFSRFRCAIGRAATKSQPAQSAIRHATAAATAGSLFVTSLIANTSGFLAALWLVARSGPSSIKPPASVASHGKPVPPTRCCSEHLPTEGPSNSRRSTIIACRLAARLVLPFHN